MVLVITGRSESMQLTTNGVGIGSSLINLRISFSDSCENCRLCCVGVALIGWLCCILWLNPVDLGIWLHGPGWIWISMGIVMSWWENERNKQISPCFCQTQIGRVETGKQCNFPLLTITSVPRIQTGWISPGVFLVKGNELSCWKTCGRFGKPWNHSASPRRCIGFGGEVYRRALSASNRPFQWRNGLRFSTFALQPKQP